MAQSGNMKWPHRLPFWFCSQVSTSHCWATFSAYLGWWLPWLFAGQIRGKHSQCLLDSDCTPASSNLQGLRVRLSWLQSRCFLKNNRRASCFFLIHQHLKLAPVKVHSYSVFSLKWSFISELSYESALLLILIFPTFKKKVTHFFLLLRIH